MIKFKEEFFNQLAWVLGVFLLMEFLWLVTGQFNFKEAFLFFWGLFFGNLLLWSDLFLYWFFISPEGEKKRQFLSLWHQRRYKTLFSWLEKEKKPDYLIFHHFIFQAVWLGLAAFIVTSTVGVFSRGLVLGVGIHLLGEEWREFFRNQKELTSWLFARTPLAGVVVPSFWLGVYLVFYSLVFLGIGYGFLF